MRLAAFWESLCTSEVCSLSLTDGVVSHYTCGPGVEAGRVPSAPHPQHHAADRQRHQGANLSRKQSSYIHTKFIYESNQKIAADVPVMMSHLAEGFIAELAARAHGFAVRDRRAGIQVRRRVVVVRLCVRRMLF